jgi:hypothetical protein
LEEENLKLIKEKEDEIENLKTNYENTIAELEKKN